MVTILPPATSLGSSLGQSLGQGLNQGLQSGIGTTFQQKFQQHQMQQQQDKEQSALQQAMAQAEQDPQSQLQALFLAPVSNETKKIMGELIVNQQRASLPRNPPGGLSGQPVPPEVGNAIQNIVQSNPNANSDQLAIEFDKANIPRAYSNSYIENRRRQDETKASRDVEVEKSKRKEFIQERAFNTGLAKEDIKKVEGLRSSIPKKETALNLARNAVETGDIEFFSKDKLADATGIDLFRTAKGAQLLTAGKENLLSNMDRVSAKAQNIWFEQRLNSMFPKIGQSREANLTTQEMLEGEVALDKAYVSEFDRLEKEDEKNYGFIKKDISRRAHENIKPLENEILKRTTYRMKEVEEQEKGLRRLKEEVGKNVIKGTPLTLAMAKLYKDKFGDKALKEAEKNGYFIPSLEEFRIFQLRPQEFREEVTK
jgi:hypothetical protein